jgi:hypothetical protein
MRGLGGGSGGRVCNSVVDCAALELGLDLARDLERERERERKKATN